MILNTLVQIRHKIKPISLSHFNLLLAIWLGMVLNVAFFQKIYNLTPYQGPKAYLFLGATVLVIVALYNFIFQLLNWKWTAKPITIALLFIGGFASYAVTSLGVLITPDQIQNLMQT
ncbi:MAG: phosphoethanolamine transferase domain-containing protein, partial [Acinetobacter sp.]